MSSRNDETSSMTMGIAFVLACVYAMVVFAIVILMFVSLVLSVVALFAWNTPRRLGNHVLMPQAARAFVYRGLAGAFLLPIFCLFLDVLFGIRIDGNYLPHILLAGYALGSLGVEILWAMNEDNQASTATYIPPSQQIAPPPQAPSPPLVPFRFASWDDEDGR